MIRAERPHDVLANEHVRAHADRLFGVERTGLQEDGVRDADLADVVDDATSKQGVQGHLWHAQSGTEVTRRLTDPLCVLLGERVLGLHSRRKREDHLLGAVERVVQGLQTQGRSDPGDKLHPLDRLGHEVVRARLERAHPIIGLVQGRDHDHRQQPAAGTRLDPPAYLVAVHAGHLDVEKNQVGGFLLDLLER